MVSQTVYLTGATGFVGRNLMTHFSRDKSKQLVTVGRSQSDLTFDHFESESLAPNSAVIHLAGIAHHPGDSTKPEEYDEVNYALTRQVYGRFVQSKATEFIFISSVKAVADTVVGELTEASLASPHTPYGISKLKAENHLRAHSTLPPQQTYILRACMIHGPGNKGNLNLLYGLVSRRIPYPLGAFDNKRSLLSIENLCFTIDQILSGHIEPGTYNVADDSPLSTNEMISTISRAIRKRPLIVHPPQRLMIHIASLGDSLPLPIDSERLRKLTESYVVSNTKLLNALGREGMPVSVSAGLSATARAMRFGTKAN